MREKGILFRFLSAIALNLVSHNDLKPALAGFLLLQFKFYPIPPLNRPSFVDKRVCLTRIDSLK